MDGVVVTALLSGIFGGLLTALFLNAYSEVEEERRYWEEKYHDLFNRMNGIGKYAKKGRS